MMGRHGWELWVMHVAGVQMVKVVLDLQILNKNE